MKHRIFGALLCAALLAPLAHAFVGCAVFDEAARHIPPGRYEASIELEDEQGRSVRGAVAYEKDEEASARAGREVLLRKEQTSGDPSVGKRAPKRIHLSKPAPSSTAAPSSPSRGLSIAPLLAVDQVQLPELGGLTEWIKGNPLLAVVLLLAWAELRLLPPFRRGLAYSIVAARTSTAIAKHLDVAPETLEHAQEEADAQAIDLSPLFRRLLPPPTPKPGA